MSDAPSSLSQQAISAALSSNWEEALRLNQEILNIDPKNVDALNRLARAYFELGDLSLSKKNFEVALETDPYNQIAAKFLKKIETFSKKGAKLQNHIDRTPISTDFFIEEAGKTKVIALLKVAEPQKLSLICAGTLVSLVIKNRGITVTDQNREYLGVLPDDLSHQLIRLINGGNKYTALIKNIKTNSLSIIIRETYRCPRFKNQPSFLDAASANLAYSSDHIIIPGESDSEPTYESDEEEDVS
ncbi:MAG: hypothetical protein Q7S44_00615 [bacterium]|nr:hypothetical protein [bacterium]